MIPIVMGARAADYRHAAPPHSYIHVEDFKSPRDLAKYLLMLDKNDDMYNQYFRWKEMGRFFNTKFWCRLCALAHSDLSHDHYYGNVEAWWRSKTTCTWDSWKRQADLVKNWPGDETEMFP